ncbi:hypothetical protein FCM35_KLT08367 [Carex littledalei]|uniref:Uncharacterized protein n=1 Tax=Carex littledalei TaxID=544730 RepID=A0A833QS50_9POAL|nr:hypothetical protein FCM35_KLT08367 [Carex littledalei]
MSWGRWQASGAPDSDEELRQKMNRQSVRNLVVLSRTQKLLKLGFTNLCDNHKGLDVKFSSYAYNILGDMSGAPKQWMTDMSDSSLQKISYGTNNVSCDVNMSNISDVRLYDYETRIQHGRICYKIILLSKGP